MSWTDYLRAARREGVQMKQRETNRVTQFYSTAWLAAALLVLSFASEPAPAETSVIPNGGGNASSANYEVKSSVGQGGGTGKSSSDRYTLGAGFWNAVASTFVPEVELSPLAGVFGQVCVCSATPEIETFLIRNIGEVECLFVGNGIDIIGPDGPDFTFVTAPDLSPLPAGVTRTVEIGFLPLGTGIRSASLVVTLDHPDAPPLSSMLLGEGVDPSPTPTSTATVTETPTLTVTETATESPTQSPTESPTVTETNTEVPPLPSATPTPTETVTATASETPTATVTETASETVTETATATETASETATTTETPTPTETQSASPTETETATPTATETEVIAEGPLYPEPLLDLLRGLGGVEGEELWQTLFRRSLTWYDPAP